MKAALLLIVLGLLVFSSSAFAIADFSEVKPGPQNYLPIALDVRYERLPSGEIQFSIKVSENEGSQSRFLKFPEDYSTYLGTMKIEYSEGDPKDKESRQIASEGNTFIRRIRSERKGNVITCVFSVTEKEVSDPDVCFFFSIVEDREFPGFSAWFARLKGFMKP